MFKALLGGLTLLFISAEFSPAAAQTCTPPPPGMVSWWPGDDDATDIVGGNDGTLMSGAGFAPGQVGQAFSFDGSDEVVVIPDSPSFDIADFTLDAWIKTANAGGGRRRIISQQGPGVFWVMALNDNQLDACASTGVDNSGSICLAFLGQSLDDDQFHHVAITRQSGVEIKWYIDGVNVKTEPTTTPGTGSFAIAADVFIGRRDPAVVDGESFNGLIDEVEIFDRALTLGEIQDIFNAGSAGKCKVTAVAIDIKPGGFPNSINPRNKGKIPVAILTTDTFDAATVDPTTIRFGRTGTEAAPVHSALEDVDGDGDADLILHFNTQATGIQCGDISASLTGETFGGQAIVGSDSIKTVGCE